MKNRIGPSLFCAFGILVLTFSVPFTGAGQKKYISTSELTGQADVVVAGKVNALKMEWNEDKSRIQTSVTIAVDETMKGGVEGGTLTVVVPGGEVDGVGEWYSHSVRFKADEEVVVFATKDRKGTMRVTLGEKGKFLVENDVKTGTKVISNIGSLKDFTTQVRNQVKAQQTIRKDG